MSEGSFPSVGNPLVVSVIDELFSIAKGSIMRMYCFADIDNKGTNAYVMAMCLEDAKCSIIKLAMDDELVDDESNLVFSDVVIGERNEPQLINCYGLT